MKTFAFRLCALLACAVGSTAFAGDNCPACQSGQHVHPSSSPVSYGPPSSLPFQMTSPQGQTFGANSLGQFPPPATLGTSSPAFQPGGSMPGNYGAGANGFSQQQGILPGGCVNCPHGAGHSHSPSHGSFPGGIGSQHSCPPGVNCGYDHGQGSFSSPLNTQYGNSSYGASQYAQPPYNGQTRCPIDGRPLGVHEGAQPISVNGEIVYTCSGNCANTLRSYLAQPRFAPTLQPSRTPSMSGTYIQ